MDLITCSECGKHYDYDKDEFCPKCGVYNPSSQHKASMRARPASRPAARPAASRGYPPPFRQETRSARSAGQGSEGKKKGLTLSQIIIILVAIYCLISFLVPLSRMAFLF